MWIAGINHFGCFQVFLYILISWNYYDSPELCICNPPIVLLASNFLFQSLPVWNTWSSFHFPDKIIMTTNYNIFIYKISRCYFNKGIYFCSSLSTSKDELSDVKCINYTTWSYSICLENISRIITIYICHNITELLIVQF